MIWLQSLRLPLWLYINIGFIQLAPRLQWGPVKLYKGLRKTFIFYFCLFALFGIDLLLRFPRKIYLTPRFVNPHWVYLRLIKAAGS